MNYETRPSTIPWPPIFLVGGIAAGLVLQWAVRLPWAVGAARDVLQGAGIVFVAVALLLYYLAINELWKHRTTVNPTAKSAHLVTTGAFAFSRNPIYLANVILICGIGLAAGNAWLVVIAFIAGGLIHRFAIAGEERHLEARFGKAWRDYAKRVRRWV